MSAIDVVIPAHPKDFAVLRHAVATTLRHVTPLRRILVVSPERFDSSNPRVVWVPEPTSGDMPTLADVRERLASRDPALSQRAGWIYQQLLKLSVPAYVDDITDSYLVVDADVMFLRAVSFDPEQDERFPYSKAIENHEPYRHAFARLFGEPPPAGFSLTVHHMLYDRELLAGMAQELQDRHGVPWTLAYIDAVDATELASISEMDVYGWWVLSRRPEVARLRQLSWRNVQVVPTAVGRAAMSLDYDFVAAHGWSRQPRAVRAAVAAKRLALELGAGRSRSLPAVSVRSVIPTRLRRTLAVTIRTQQMAWRARRAPQRDPAEIFGDVYAHNIWGTGETAFYSGGGSDARFADPYCEAVRAFVDELALERAVIVDLGCGDFRVGRALIEGWAVEYVGLDVVPALIEHNQQSYGREGVSFVCADVVADELPPGDVCLVRQVLQHLSNDEIRAVLAKLERYPHVIVTEHYPADETTAIANLDKVPGADTRLAENSAVYLDRPPYSRAIRPLLAIPAEPGEIRTFALVRKR